MRPIRGTNSYAKKYEPYKLNLIYGIIFMATVVAYSRILMQEPSGQSLWAAPPIVKAVSESSVVGVSSLPLIIPTAVVEDQAKRAALPRPTVIPEVDQIVAYIAKVFKPEGNGVVVKAISCFFSESSLNTLTYNVNKNGTVDRGIAMINSVHKMKVEDAHNYQKNINKAYELYKASGFRPWYGRNCK